MQHGGLAFSDIRREDRDEVHYRTRAVHADGRPLQVLVVNLSPHGFMARCEARMADADLIRITLPGVGQLATHVRWALGGRIGCQFERPISLAHYYELLAIVLR